MPNSLVNIQAGRSSHAPEVAKSSSSSNRVMYYLKFLIVVFHCSVLVFDQLDAVAPAVGSATTSRPQLDRSGWRLLTGGRESAATAAAISSASAASDQRQQVREAEDLLSLSTSAHKQATTTTTTKTPKSRSKKLIEWDDDDLTNELRDSIKQDDDDDQDHDEDNERPTQDSSTEQFFVKPRTSSKAQGGDYYSAGRKATNSKFSRLIYHGQVKQNGAMKVIDGIKLHINTHRPLVISRRSSSSSLSPSSSSLQSSPSVLQVTGQQHKNSTKSEAEPSSSTLQPTNEAQVAESSSSSDWKPIVLVARARRTIETTTANKNKRQTTASSSSDHSVQQANSSSEWHHTSYINNKAMLLEPKIGQLKWKPIKTSFAKFRPTTNDESSGGGRAEKETTDEFKTIFVVGETTTTTPSPSDRAVRGKKATIDHSSHRQATTGSMSSISEPFDDYGIITASTGTLDDEAAASGSGQKQRETPKSANVLSERTKKSMDNRWTPVETTTTVPDAVTTTVSSDDRDPMTTLPPPTTAANGSQLETAHRSASDLNYIYSSQPVSSQADWSTGGGGVRQQLAESRSSSNAYYSNYVLQPQLPIEQQQQQLPIIDTTSGQTPEMIADRVPEAPPMVGVSGGSDYSSPQVSASFQPAPPPPQRLPYGGGYDSAGASGYYGAAPAAPPTRLQRQAAAAPPATQLVRQEHHYHYYNQQQQQRDQRDQREQQPERQLQVQQAPQSIVRELQPLFITQPIITQQQSTTTTTQAPPPREIIREIIKEVPVVQAAAPLPPPPPFQLPRFIMPPPPPPAALVREPIVGVQMDAGGGEGQHYGGGAPAVATSAQRFIRTISSGLPSMRLAPLPQVRLPLAAPLPLAAGIRFGPLPGLVPVTRQTGSFVIPPMPKKTTTFLTETQAVPTHTTIMHTTQFTPATRTTVYTTDHQPTGGGYRR